jgi:hypothetical protein
MASLTRSFRRPWFHESVIIIPPRSIGRLSFRGSTVAFGGAAKNRVSHYLIFLSTCPLARARRLQAIDSFPRVRMNLLLYYRRSLRFAEFGRSFSLRIIYQRLCSHSTRVERFHSQSSACRERGGAPWSFWLSRQRGTDRPELGIRNFVGHD